MMRNVVLRLGIRAWRMEMVARFYKFNSRSLFILIRNDVCVAVRLMLLERWLVNWHVLLLVIGLLLTLSARMGFVSEKSA